MKKTRQHPAVIDLLGGDDQNPTGAGRANTTPSKQRPTTGRRRPTRTAAAAAAGLLIVAGIGFAALRSITGTDDPQPPIVTADAPTTSTADTAALDAVPPAPTAEPTPTADPTTCRTDSGNQDSGPGVIAAFEHAYYVDRSGDAARALAAPDSPLPAGPVIQTSGIDTVPVGTTHCVRITPITSGVYAVALAEMRPGQPPKQWAQTITTKELDGRWFIDVIS
jgi:hypothetical protein